MGSRALLLLRPTTSTKDLYFKSRFLSEALIVEKRRVRSYSVRSTIHPPDLPRLAETARIYLTPDEVEEFAPKIQQVVDWFGQLQAVDLQSIQPAIRADTKGENLRDDVPETFENSNSFNLSSALFFDRDAMIAAVPSYEEPFIKVPKVLNKEEGRGIRSKHMRDTSRMAVI
ncbi:hypothetical protein TEA_008103 [Camellia sinensis var. sinensis]|uniref:Glutamyl-tRNA(Gln) amidotransferase subunit C, chloroplastic/mitochondrial n=1 Tax=Camellia sinensis var. sinensis TaxID=542762 RepID=A0A4S4D8V1_CAMSN|nr:hypothetical protein TEA_008103 [Camellia sinensis var. sinensis]